MLPAPKFFILVVDNHSTAATTMSWVLEESGYAVSVVSDGKAALDIVSGIAFDLAVVEIILPDIGSRSHRNYANGYQTAEFS